MKLNLEGRQTNEIIVVFLPFKTTYVPSGLLIAKVSV